jgi:hypothetical protein
MLNASDSPRFNVLFKFSADTLGPELGDRPWSWYEADVTVVASDCASEMSQTIPAASKTSSSNPVYRTSSGAGLATSTRAPPTGLALFDECVLP